MADQIRPAQESYADKALPSCLPIGSDTATSFESGPFALEAVTRTFIGLRS